MKTIHAVYEQGVFRPLEDVDLAERTEVEFEPKVLGQRPPAKPIMKGILEVMAKHYETGCPDIAARHNEHQP